MKFNIFHIYQYWDIDMCITYFALNCIVVVWLPFWENESLRKVHWSDVFFLWFGYGKVVVIQIQKFCEHTLCLEHCTVSSDDLALFKIVTYSFIRLVYLKETRRIAFLSNIIGCFYFLYKPPEHESFHLQHEWLIVMQTLCSTVLPD